MSPQQYLELAKEQYKQRHPNSIAPFSYCIIYLVIDKRKHISVKFYFQEDIKLIMNVIHKRPLGMIPGEQISNIDIREYTNIHIPKFENKFYFDFVFFVLDTNTQQYWATNLWTNKICSDLRYYLSSERKLLYKKAGLSLANKYTTTMILGHV